MTEVDTITGKDYDSFDEDVMVALSVGRGTKEDDRLVVLEIAVGDEVRQSRGGREGDTFHHDVVAYQQGAGHGSGGNDEVLEEKAHDKEPDGESGTEGGQLLNAGALLVITVFCHEGFLMV